MKKGISFTVIALLLVLVMVVGCASKESDKSDDVKTESRDDIKDNGTDRTEDKAEYESETTQGAPTNQDISDTDYTYTADNEQDMEEPAQEEARYEEGLEVQDYENASYNPVSTFSVDVDTASYSMIRNSLKDGYIPYESDIRIEEMINYFTYDYDQPTDTPFSINTEVGICPWNEDYIIAKIGLNGKEIEMDERELTNIVFLMDVSGSMNDSDKLPLLKESFRLLVDSLSENDRVSIVVYAGSSGVILDGARGDQKYKILDAINELEAGGSTAGGEGIELAYKIARKHFIRNGNNRVILATDGDFNVGLSGESELKSYIEDKREEGIFLSCLGFGSNSRNFDTMEILADNGNGHFAYIDSSREAKRVMIEELGSTLYTIAKDVKVQVEFNPNVVSEYSLIGYENRRLENHEFNDDKVDAGDIGAGHQVTALYMIKLVDFGLAEGEELRYQDEKEEYLLDELMYVKLRYKEPNEDVSQLITEVVKNDIKVQTSNDFKFACAVAEFGMALGNDVDYDVENFETLYDDTMDYVLDNPDSYKIEFVSLITLAKSILD